jgi:hypothetical protein
VHVSLGMQGRGDRGARPKVFDYSASIEGEGSAREDRRT